MMERPPLRVTDHQIFGATAEEESAVVLIQRTVPMSGITLAASAVTGSRQHSTPRGATA